MSALDKVDRLGGTWEIDYCFQRFVSGIVFIIVFILGNPKHFDDKSEVNRIPFCEWHKSLCQIRMIFLGNLHYEVCFLFQLC